VYYDFDSYELSSSAEDRLAKNASFMAEHPEFTFSIEGHCDDRGTNEYNLALGERRASAAMNYVAGKGVTGDRLKTISYGEERGVCSEQSESCWRQNRRAYFRITGRR
ncbi:MAG: peptidoglycan-associated lipoprotein Pal, partial [Acidobacteriota bacterium]